MRILIIIAAIFSSSILAKTLPATNFQTTHNFIDKMVKQHRFDKNQLLFIFSKVELKVAEKKIKEVN